jgi:predicted metal-binding membrane protein
MLPGAGRETVDEAGGLLALEQLLRRDRLVALISLVTASLLAWAYLLAGAGMHSMSMPDMAMSVGAAWTSSHFVIMLAMWAIMMIAMMLPSAAPMILLFATIERRRTRADPFSAVAKFTAAYLVVWIGFSIVATLAQWLLDRLMLLSPALTLASALFAGLTLIATGAYQFTPWKQACLRNCRSPLEFISLFWSDGPFVLGLRHGLYCVGCCWMLMLLLFVGGVMNMLWVALIAAFVLAEKALPRGEWVGYIAGAALIGWGGWTVYVHAFA